MYKNVSLPSIAAFQSSWILMAITLVVGPNLLFGGFACGLVLGPLPSCSVGALSIHVSCMQSSLGNPNPNGP